jgi:hypothetical protein
MRASAITVLLASGLALTGCASSSSPEAPPASAHASAPASEPAPGPTGPITPTAVTPVVPEELTAETVTAESTRVADAIQALIDPALVRHVDNHAELMESSGGGRYYGIIRTVTLDPATDPVASATAVVAELESSGWINRETTDQNGTYVSALTSLADPASAWFAVIGGDATVDGESAVSIQIASPDVP